MGLEFEFATASRIIFGSGRISEISRVIPSLGSRVLLVSGVPEGNLSDRVIKVLSEARIDWSMFQVRAEPSLKMIQSGLEKARSLDCDLIIGLGGGSAIDTGKAIASLMTNPGEIMEYLEVVGRGLPLINKPLPFVAIPTTAGTGSEVTRNAVIEVDEFNIKVSLRSPLMLPSVALVDPELTIDLPPQVTASTGMDALTQLIEPFVSNRANPLTDGICREGIERVGKCLLRAYKNGDDLEAREGMSLSSLFGGLALANSRLGAVHGFAAPLGGLLHAPHGAICACLLPYVIEANLSAIRQRSKNHPAVSRYNEIARILLGRNDVGGDELVEWLKQLCQDLKIDRLKKLGLTEEQFPFVAEKAARASSMQGNPVNLNQDELIRILENAS